MTSVRWTTNRNTLPESWQHSGLSLGVSDGPPVDTPLIDGTIGFHYHTGGHTITPADWKAFLDFAARHLR